MPALNFKKQFASAVLEGRKTQTIRATRKVPIKAGDWLHLFTGMRTMQCQRLRVVKCTAVHDITIRTDDRILIDGKLLSLNSAYKLAVADGFADPFSFVDFFEKTHVMPFTGQLIEWRP